MKFDLQLTFNLISTYEFANTPFHMLVIFLYIHYIVLCTWLYYLMDLSSCIDLNRVQFFSEKKEKELRVSTLLIHESKFNEKKISLSWDNLRNKCAYLSLCLFTVSHAHLPYLFRSIQWIQFTLPRINFQFNFTLR